MIKKIFSIKIILFLSIFISTFALFHTSVYAATDDQKVYDNASLLSEDEKNKLEDLCNTYGEKGKIDIVIVTINDSDVGDCDLYLEDLYDSVGFGYDKVKGDTAMIIVDMYLRKVSIQGYGKAETYISSDRGDIIRDKITSYLTDGEYYKAFSKFVKLSSEYMNIAPDSVSDSDSYNDSDYDSDYNLSNDSDTNSNNILLQWQFQILVSIGISLVIVVLMIHQSGGKVTVNSNTYLDHNSANIKVKRDNYIRTTVTRVPKPKPSDNDNGGGGSSGGSSHSTSSGSF